MFKDHDSLPSVRSTETIIIDTSPSQIEPFQQVNIDLKNRTWQSLDFQIVLDGLASECQTGMGRRIASHPHFSDSFQDVQNRYEVITEIWNCIDPVPLRSGMDIERLIDVAASGAVLEVDELREISNALEGLDELQRWLAGSINQKAFIPRLRELGEPIQLDSALVGLLKDSFTEEGDLCGTKFPKLGNLRRDISTKKIQIRSMLQSLLQSSDFTNMLADEQIMEIDGRFVVAVKPTYKRSVGIVHDTSRSGKTIYVEPAQVVEPTNELKELSLMLKIEESQILQQMTLQISLNENLLRRCLAAAAEIDLANARARLGRKLDAIIPVVDNKGEIDVYNAKNPVLTLLKGDLKVVGNDISVSRDVACLVLTGPNAGGKTVILKTLGVFALMVRSGLPIPCRRGGRFDFFQTVLADIGDLQSVSSELSTFSGHLMVCKAVLDSSGEGTLVLMDEMGSGTDPAQGAALAQALLETLLTNGARIAITTHFLQLKDLAAKSEKYAVAAMQFLDGKPTYKMIKGAVGESFALAVAERLNLPSTVVERARLLLDENERKVSDLIQELEAERDSLREQKEELTAVKQRTLQKEQELQALKESTEKDMRRAKQTAASDYSKKYEEMEKRLKELMNQIKENLNAAEIEENFQEVRGIRQSLQEEVDKAKENPKLVPISKDYKLAEGAWVVVMAKGFWYNAPAKVIGYGGRNRVELDMGNGVTERFKISDLSLPPEGTNIEAGAQKSKEKKKEKYTGMSRRVKAILEEEVAAKLPKTRVTIAETKELPQVLIRTDANTMNVIGKRYEEAERQCTFFFSDCLMRGFSTCFILHGHGTGQLKLGLRQWLRSNPLVKSVKPAGHEDGGDAVTVIVLKT